MDMDIVSVDEARRHFPLMRAEGLRGALWTPGDGHVDPASVALAFARGARDRGVRIRIGTQVTGMRWTGAEWWLSTSQGEVRAEYVVNCAGMWAQEIANMVGVTLPLVVFMHQHLVTEDHPAVKALPRELALIRDPAGGFNCRQEGRGLLSGVYEHTPEFVFVDGIPPAFGKELMAPNYDRSADFIARAIERVPALGEVGVKMVYNGPTSRTPDHQPLFGPIPGLRNHFIAAGFAAGFVQAGFTKYLAQWIVDGEPELDLSELHAARFGVHADRAFAFDVVRAAHAFSNTPNYPHAERSAGRPAQTGPLYDRQAARRACFGVRAGVEVVNWYAPPGRAPSEQPRFGRPDWHEVVGEECAAITGAAGLMDLAHRYAFEVTGTDATTFLARALASPPPPVGACAPGLLLTARGTVASLATVLRPSADRVLLIGPGERRTWDMDLLRRRVLDGERVALHDATGGLVRLLLAGPKAGAVIHRAAEADLRTPAVMAPGFAGLLHLDYVPTVVARTGETGEAEWLLVAPAELARRLDEVLCRCGEPDGMRHVGLRALDALGLEAGQPVVGVDADRSMTPAQASVAHLLADAGDGPPADVGRRRVLMAVDAGAATGTAVADPYRNDLVRFGDTAIGLVGSGGFGYRCGFGLAQAVLPVEYTAPGTRLSIEILGQPRAASVLTAPPLPGRAGGEASVRTGSAR